MSRSLITGILRHEPDVKAAFAVYAKNETNKIGKIILKFFF
jgi:hypothetical protein